MAALAGTDCSKGSATPSADAAATDGGEDAGLPACGEESGAGGGTVVVTPTGASDIDEFGPNAQEAKMVSSIGRLNVYTATAPRMLDQVEVYLAAALPGTRVTIAVQEAVSATAAFQKVFEVQVSFGVCQGWASSGPLAIPMIAGHAYAIGIDPNQPITAYVSADSNALPIDGAFGALVSSKTSTSVSTTGLSTDKTSTAEFNRQRLTTSPRTPDARDVVIDAGAATDGPTDATAGDAARG
ncbi:MAG TPA: hypothetical protein VHU40_14945 [Polyangia bacterium]|nr:hypothetical protein [Polyangia bacterium]